MGSKVQKLFFWHISGLSSCQAGKGGGPGEGVRPSNAVRPRASALKPCFLCSDHRLFYLLGFPRTPSPVSESPQSSLPYASRNQAQDSVVLKIYCLSLFVASRSPIQTKPGFGQEPLGPGPPAFILQQSLLRASPTQLSRTLRKVGPLLERQTRRLLCHTRSISGLSSALFVLPVSVSLGSPSPPRSDRLREAPPPAPPPPNPTKILRAESLLSKADCCFEHLRLSPLQRGTLLVTLMDKILIASLSSKTQSASVGAGRCREWPLEWKTEVTKTKVPGVTIFQAWCVLPDKPSVVSGTGGEWKRRPAPGFQGPLPSSPGGPLLPSLHPTRALATPVFMSTEQSPVCPRGAWCPWPVVCVPRLGSDRGTATPGLGLWGNALLGSQLSGHINTHSINGLLRYLLSQSENLNLPLVRLLFSTSPSWLLCSLPSEGNSAVGRGPRNSQA